MDFFWLASCKLNELRLTWVFNVLVLNVRTHTGTSSQNSVLFVLVAAIASIDFAIDFVGTRATTPSENGSVNWPWLPRGKIGGAPDLGILIFGRNKNAAFFLIFGTFPL